MIRKFTLEQDLSGRNAEYLNESRSPKTTLDHVLRSKSYIHIFLLSYSCKNYVIC